MSLDMTVTSVDEEVTLFFSFPKEGKGRFVEEKKKSF